MSTKSLRILVLTISTRPRALGPVVTQWLLDAVGGRAASLGASLVPVSLAELDLPFLDEEEEPSSGVYRNEHTRRWSAMVAAADGFIAVTPEYNYGMPAVLKNALDYLGREWAWKPIGFVSYGNTSAGTRSVQHSKQVVTTLRLVPLGATVAIRIGESVEDGRLLGSAGRDAAGVRLVEELVRVAHALRPVREWGGYPGGPVAGSYVRALTPSDAAEVTVLQRCCWVEEALANDTLAIPALHESLDDVRSWLGTWDATGVWLDGRLVGMVRTRLVGSDWHVGRLAVVPDLRGRGLGRWLLRSAGSAAPAGSRRMVLVTGAKSLGNQALYESEEYRRVSAGTPDGTVSLAKDVGLAGEKQLG
jgi:NAD(P)H-dependent FMN reductase/GNAT superfamily N-acetyltransferase